jgi:hypothetical protein
MKITVLRVFKMNGLQWCKHKDGLAVASLRMKIRRGDVLRVVDGLLTFREQSVPILIVRK